MAWNLFSKKASDTKTETAPVFLTNTLTRKKERFVPQKPGTVTMYSCGPTVYSKVHIGNLRAYIFSDTLARTLTHAGYHVKRVMNITDVGHLTSDGDEGEDKMEVGARREGLSAQAIADRYTKIFLDDLAALDVDTKSIIFPHATEYIKEQISLARTLEEKGFAYRTTDGLYFDTSKFAGYGKLGGLSEAELEAGARIEVNPEKRHPADFALWKTTPAGVHRLQEWDSPWERGCPGWHLECSAMARSLLGIEIDIHTGGEDLAYTHHNAEIAQSEAASGRPFVRYWMHNAFLNINDSKISKSVGNVVYLSDITDRGMHPLALRYFFHQAHYRTPLSFSWDALEGAGEALTRLWRLTREIAAESGKRAAASETQLRFISAMRDDLNTPQALGLLWDALRDEDLSSAQKWQIVLDADALLALSLANPPAAEEPITDEALPEDVRALRTKRDEARKAKDFATADALRTELQARGYRVEDSPTGTLLFKK
ncbi:MAG TPA: cysteine--tRNA ligase [Candidatus Paceibacterota bacterium]